MSSMFICAAWRRIKEGPMQAERTLVYRCDLDEGHEGRHCDQVLLVDWDDSDTEPESKPRNTLLAARPPALESALAAANERLKDMECIEDSQHKAVMQNEELRNQLFELQWREITPQDLPKVGDEVGGWQDNSPDPSTWDICRAQYAFADPELTLESALMQDWMEIEMTHFRPINPPRKAAPKEQDVHKS